MYQASDRTVDRVSDNGVKVIQSWSSKEEILAFVDSDEENCDPKHMLRKHTVQITLASFPKVANRGWIKQVGRVNIVLAIEPWSPREPFLAGFVLRFLRPTLD